jgi:replicative DNA helicase
MKPGLSRQTYTGFASFDKETSGLYSSDLFVLVSRPSIGKTTLSLNVASYVAMHTGKPVIYMTTRKSCLETRKHMLCSLGLIDCMEIQARGTSAMDQHYLDVSPSIFPGLNLFFSQKKCTRSVFKFVNKIKYEYGAPGLLVIDELQSLLSGHGIYVLDREIADVMRAFKSLAVELDIPVIVLAPQNRNVFYRDCPWPVENDLNFYHTIETYADMIAFLYKDWIFKNTPPNNYADLVITKQKKKLSSRVRLYFDIAVPRFDNPGEIICKV